MKMDGQLERAQFENIANASPTPAPTGRFYIDTTAADGTPRIYTGSVWRPFRLGQSAALYDNGTVSSKTFQVNWANGLNQKITLGAHVIISFTNPVPGEVHRLVVIQRPTEASATTPYMYKFDMADQANRRSAYQPVGQLQSSETAQHAWFYAAGVRPSYSTVPAPISGNPNVALGAAVVGIDISPKFQYIATAGATTPFSVYYPIFDSGGNKWTWGLKNSFPGTQTSAPSAAVGVAYSPDGNYVIYALTASPFIVGDQLLPGTEMPVGALSQPATLPAGAAQCLAMHPGGAAVAVGHTTTPFLSAYPINQGAAFGTKYVNPATLPAAQVNACAFAPTGDFLAVSSQTTPFLQVYPFDVNTGFGTIASNPSPLPAGGPAGSLGKAICWRPQGDWIVMGMTVTPFLYAVPFSRSTGTFGTPQTISVGIPAGQVTSVQFTPDGQYLVVGCTTSPFFYVYAFNSSTGVNAGATALDGSNPGVQVNDIAVAMNGEWAVLALNGSPYVMAYPLPRSTRNYLKIAD